MIRKENKNLISIFKKFKIQVFTKMKTILVEMSFKVLLKNK